MSHISKPVDWEVYNIPSVEPVQYYSILKKKREFSQLIKEYDAQVFRKGYLHYCGIVPKNMNLSLRNRYDIFIVFLGETPHTSFIGFSVKVSKETFQHESNKLLLFLKKSKRAIFYLMNNNCIQVQCGANAWELFYLLYDDYLREYVLTIIGTQFFYHFVYSCCIQKELQLSEILYKGSKVIKISKKSVFFKVHRKRKISVTDLIHMTCNLPKKRSYVTYFDSKEPIFYSNFVNRDLYSAAGSKIQISKLFLKKFKVTPENNANGSSIPQNEETPRSVLISHVIRKQKDPHLDEHIQKTPIILKRKLNEIKNSDDPSTSKCFKTFSVENQWKQYQNLTHYPLKSYSVIPSVNPLFHKLLNENSYHHLTATETDSKSPTSDNEKYQVNVSTVHDTPVLMSFMAKQDDNETANYRGGSASSSDNKRTSAAENCSNPFMPKFVPYRSEEDCNAETAILPTSEKHNCDVLNSSLLKDGSFTTAAGKAINISAAALQKAQQLVENDLEDESKQILPNTSSYIPSKRKIHSKIPYPSLRKKGITNSANLPEVLSSKVSNDTLFGKNSKMTGNDSPAVSTVSSEDVRFSTAAGREIRISNTAMEAAQKLIQNVIVEEGNNGSISGHVQKNENFQNRTSFQEIDCSKTVETIDETLVEKLFEDTLFDEKDSEITNESNKINVSVPQCDKANHAVLKPRKSLGGRRSMKYCSEKL